MNVRWRKTDKYYQLVDDMAVYGTVTINTVKSDFGNYDVYEWVARTMMWSKPNKTDSPRGFAKSVEGAKKIVEVLCENTQTYL